MTGHPDIIGEGALPEPSALLCIKNLRTYFRVGGSAIKAVDGVDITVAEGRILGVVGESGSGKSVMVSSIMSLVEPPGTIEPGSQIWFRGSDLVQKSEREWRSIRGNEIAMIFQEPMTSLNPVYTVGNQIIENIRLHRSVSRRAARQRAIDMMRLVGIPAPELRVDSWPHQLSGGMRQRVMIAMALVCDPVLLLADEPTTALDVTVQAQILKLLARLRDELGMAIMLITHDLGVVAEICDEVAVMYGGQIVERGTTRDVLSSPKHPYTRSLIACIPRLGLTGDAPLSTIPGMVPSPKNWPRGCRFANRCDLVFDQCHDEMPPLRTMGRQKAACWLDGGHGLRKATAAAGNAP